MCVINGEFLTFAGSEPVYISPIDLEQYVSRLELQLNISSHLYGSHIKQSNLFFASAINKLNNVKKLALVDIMLKSKPSTPSIIIVINLNNAIVYLVSVLLLVNTTNTFSIDGVTYQGLLCQHTDSNLLYHTKTIYEIVTQHYSDHGMYPPATQSLNF